MPSFQPGSLLLGDAFYPTWFFLDKIQQQGVDILMEQQGARRRTTDFKIGQPLGERDHLIDLDKPKMKPDWLSQEEYDVAPHSIQVRGFKAGEKIMVTTLMSAKKYPKSELKQLYKSRWNIEVSLRDIKDIMGMNILSCKTPDMVMKEIWVYLLAYNLIRWLMCEAAKVADIVPQQISFKHCLQLWLHWGAKGALLDELMYQSLLWLMSKQRVGNRPDRIEPRAVKRRPKAYPLLMKKRVLAREDIKKNGHPKKLK